MVSLFVQNVEYSLDAGKMEAVEIVKGLIMFYYQRKIARNVVKIYGKFNIIQSARMIKIYLKMINWSNFYFRIFDVL